MMYGRYDKVLRTPVCRCCVCGKELYGNDEVYESDLYKEPEYICENCIDDYTFDNDFEIKEAWKDQNIMILREVDE